MKLGKPWILAVLAVSLLYVWSGCTKPRRVVLTKEQKERILAHVLEEAPEDVGHRLNADFNGRVRLLGVKVPDKPVRAGERFDITYYWQCVKPLEGDWKVFVHLENPGPPEQRRQILDHHPVGELYPIHEWQAGQIIEDIQSVHLDSGFPSGTANLWVGVFNEAAWRDQGRNDRLQVVNINEVPHDGDNRVRAAQIEMIGEKDSKAPARVPRTYDIIKTSVAPTIDGSLDEDIWRLARLTRPFVRPDGKPVAPRMETRARLLWDEEYLYIGFQVTDDDIWNPHTDRDSPLWEHDVVEIFLDPGADQKDYVEIQVSPANVIFDAWFDEHRRPAWPEAAKRFDIGVKSAVSIDGSVNVRDDGIADRAWTVEVAIPFAELPGREGPPEEGETWGLNLYRLDSRGASNMDNQATWAPVGGDFHALKDAGRVTFRGARPSPPAPLGPGGVPPTSPSVDRPAPVLPAPAEAPPEAEEPQGPDGDPDEAAAATP